MAVAVAMFKSSLAYLPWAPAAERQQKRSH